jgi:hypothetical protein
MRHWLIWGNPGIDYYCPSAMPGILMRAPRRTSLIIAVLAATLALAGCGGAHTHSPRAAQLASASSYMGSVAPPGWGEAGPPPSLELTPAPSSTATMYDSVAVSAIPRSPFAAAGYTGGIWRTFPQLRTSYPQAHVVSIAVFAWERAECLDVEPGDAEPDQVPGWIRADERAGYRKPCLYSDYWEWTHELAPILVRNQIARSTIFEWVASYVGHPQLLPGFDADQWTDHCLGRSLDCSLVLRSFLAAAQPPLRAPAPPAPPCRSCGNRQRLHQLDLLLGAHSRQDPWGHNCADPPYRHAYSSARFDHPCAVWAAEARALR